MFILGTHNNLLITTVLLSTHNKLFDSEMRKQYILTYIWSLYTSKSKYDLDVSQSQVFQFGHNMSDIHIAESLKYLSHYSFIGFYSLDKKILLSTRVVPVSRGFCYNTRLCTSNSMIFSGCVYLLMETILYKYGWNRS